MWSSLKEICLVCFFASPLALLTTRAVLAVTLDDGDYCPGNGHYRSLTVLMTCGTTVGAPVFVSEDLCSYTFAWESLYACPTTPSFVTLTSLMSDLAMGKSARLVYNLKICTGTDRLGGMSLASFEYFGREVVGNELAFLGYDESNIIKNVAASTGYVHRLVTTRVYEDQTVVIEYNDVDVGNYKLISNNSILCHYGLPTDGVTFVTGFF